MVRGGDVMEIDRDLTIEFIQSNKVTELIILDEVKRVDGDYGRYYSTRVNCNDFNKTLALWNINRTSKNSLIDLFGTDTKNWIGKIVVIDLKPYGTEKFSIIVNVTKTAEKKSETVPA